MSDTATGGALALSDEFADAFNAIVDAAPPEPGRDDEDTALEDADDEETGDGAPPEPEAVVNDDDRGEEGGEAVVNDDDRGEEGGEAPPPTEDIWATATPAQRAAYEAARSAQAKLEHQQRSDRGRIAALQRQISQRDQSPRPTAGNDGEAASGAKAPDPLNSEATKRFREEYPEIADPIMEIMAAQQRQIAAADAVLESYTAEQRAKFYLDQKAQVVSVHPDYEKIARSPEFVSFYETAPDFVRKGIERNADEIEDASEVAAIIKLFKADRGIAGAAPPPPSEGTPNLNARRERQLRAGAGVQNRGPGAGATAPDEFEAAFSYYADKRKPR